jgi:hypothetical protein
MKGKIVPIIIIMLMISLSFSFTIYAGEEENPEIVDEENDTFLYSLDIISAWFYEKPDESEYLYTAMKVKLLNPNTNAVLSIRWTHNGKEYVSGLDTFRYREDIFRCGDPQRATYWQWTDMPECEGIIDIENNIFIWKILKSNIGNPKSGDILTNTKAAAVPGFPISFIYFFTGRDARDFAPNVQGEYGLNYIIK